MRKSDKYILKVFYETIAKEEVSPVQLHISSIFTDMNDPYLDAMWLFTDILNGHVPEMK